MKCSISRKGMLMKTIDVIRNTYINGKEFSLNLVTGWNDLRAQEAGKKLLEHIIKNGAKPIRYSELADMVDFECPAILIDKYLGALSYSCMESGLPPASTVVVNDNMMPGKGFYKAYYPGVKLSGYKDIEIFCEQMKRIEEFNDWDVILKLYTASDM